MAKTVLWPLTQAFGFTTSGKDERKGAQNSQLNPKHVGPNLLKSSAYIPIIGPIFHIAIAILMINDVRKDNRSKRISIGYTIAFSVRAALSPLAPITLLAPDIIITIVYAVKKHQNNGNHPFPDRL